MEESLLRNACILIVISFITSTQMVRCCNPHRQISAFLKSLKPASDRSKRPFVSCKCWENHPSTWAVAACWAKLCAHSSMSLITPAAPALCVSSELSGRDTSRRRAIMRAAAWSADRFVDIELVIQYLQCQKLILVQLALSEDQAVPFLFGIYPPLRLRSLLYRTTASPLIPDS